MASRLPWLVLAGTFSASVLGIAACKTEGPSAPPRKNGCIDTGCAPVTTAAPPSADGGTNGATTGTRAEDVEADVGEADDETDDKP